MPGLINLAALTQNRASASIDLAAVGLPGQVVEVEYYPTRLTAQMLVDLADTGHVAGLSEARALAVVTSPAQHLLTLLASWNLSETDPESGEERPLPLDEPHIAALGVMLQWALLGGLMAAQNKAAAGEAAAPVASANASPSGATSSPTAP